jgi:hypothetical protein
MNVNLKSLSFLLLICLPIYGIGQNTKLEMMQKLEFLTGEWIGTSSSIKNDSAVSSQPAYEKIEFKLDQHILTIDLLSPSLQLHTVINYDEDDQTYYYQPFYKNGSGKYPAQILDGKLVVSPSSMKRFIFELTPDGRFREYGEEMRDGTWKMYFEDIFEKN